MKSKDTLNVVYGSKPILSDKGGVFMFRPNQQLFDMRNWMQNPSLVDNLIHHPIPNPQSIQYSPSEVDLYRDYYTLSLMTEQRELEKKWKQFQRLQQKQSELLYGYNPAQVAQMKPPRLTKVIAEEFIAYHIGVEPSKLKFVKAPEDFSKMRHACKYGGVQEKEVAVLIYDTTAIKVGFCHYCGTVHYYYELEPSFY